MREVKQLFRRYIGVLQYERKQLPALIRYAHPPFFERCEYFIEQIFHIISNLFYNYIHSEEEIKRNKNIEKPLPSQGFLG